MRDAKQSNLSSGIIFLFFHLVFTTFHLLFVRATDIINNLLSSFDRISKLYISVSKRSTNPMAESPDSPQYSTGGVHYTDNCILGPPLCAGEIDTVEEYDYV